MEDYKDISYINCRRIRKERSMTLRELSEKSGISTVYLSNYENGKANITVASLYAIAKALDTSVNKLISPEDVDDDLVLVPQNKRFALAETADNPMSVFQEFLTRGSSFDMQVTVMHLKPHTDSGAPKIHDSDEFIYVLEGELTLHYGEEKEPVLKKGDFAYYNALKHHFWENASDEPLEFLAVASRAGF